MKNKITTIVIIIATVILAGIAVFTAVRLYQLRKESVAPTAPESKPEAAAPISCTALSFNLSTPPPILLKCNSACYQVDISAECGQGLSCLNTSSDPNSLILKCRNPQCPSQANCICATPTPTATPTATPTSSPTATPTATPTGSPGATSTPTPVSTATPGPTSTPIAGATPTGEPALPSAGISFPTIFGIGLGALLLIGALILAL